MKQPWGLIEYLTQEIDQIFANNEKEWKKGDFKDKRRMVMNAIQKARDLNEIANKLHQ